MSTRKILTIAMVSLFLLAGCSGGGDGGGVIGGGDESDIVDSGGDSGSNSDTGGTSNTPGDTGGGSAGNDGGAGSDTGSGSTGGDTGGDGNTGGSDPVITGKITDGIWIGTYTINGTDTDFDVVIYDNQLFGFTSSLGYEGVLTLDNTSISGTLNEYINTGELSGTVSIDGTVVENTSITGSLGDAGATFATFELSMDALYDRTASGSKIAGTWLITAGTYTLTFVIMDYGTFDGSDTSGCIFEGEYSVPDASHNIYQITYMVSNCGSNNGDYSGLALLDDYDAGTDNALVFTSVTTDYLNIGYLIKQ
jgi:hypothetical protein